MWNNYRSFYLLVCLLSIRFVAGTEHDPSNDVSLTDWNDKGIDATIDEANVVLWPFSHHNSSDKGGSDSDTDSKKNSTQGDKVCADSSTCEVCNSYYTCHWCAHDSSCHAIGSIHGCLIGSTCAKPKPAHNDTNDPTGCSAHSTCSECALASHLCHWCAHDNACHSVGSVYGCVSGVDCYDNPHCQRTQPEPYSMDTPGIGLGPLVAIWSLAFVLIACATCGCCVCSCLKGAYDDLADLATASAATEPLLPDAFSPPDEPDEPQMFVDSLMTTSEEPDIAVLPEGASTESNNNEPTGDATATTVPEEQQPLLSEPDVALQAEDGYQRMVDGGVAAVDYRRRGRQQRRALPTSHRPKRRRFAAMHKLYVGCMGCYLCTLLFVGLLTFFAIYYFPQKPIYNICNDSVAWKSLIDSMTSMKATAEFEILASIYNPNHLDVALDMGKGSFSHDGAFVGTYEIPPTYIAANAISDILIVASFTPEKWQALSITAEYYRGTLVMHVDAAATIRIPALFDYTISTSLKDIVVHVNEMSDRHLCACPTWSDASNHSHARPFSIPEWVQ